MTNEQEQRQNNQNNNNNIDIENVLWEVVNEQKKGFLRKKIVSTSRVAITNRRNIINDYELPLQDISDVVVLNRHSTSQAQYTNYNVRSGGRNVRSGVGVGNIQSKSKTIGDIVIISPNRTDMIITDVADRQGVRDLIMALWRNL